MRRWVVALGFIALTLPAIAADFEPSIFNGSPYVAGPPTYTRWTGFYVGGQAGGGTTLNNFSGFAALGLTTHSWRPMVRLRMGTV